MDLEVAPPFLTYDDAVTLWSGDLRCEVRYVGTPAHTTNDSIVFLPERGVLFAGDLIFRGGTPFLLMGSISGAIRVLQEVVAPLAAARQADLGDYADLLDAERIVGNLHRAYAEVDGAPPGAPFDVATALADMVAYDGGRPLTCHA